MAWATINVGVILGTMKTKAFLRNKRADLAKFLMRKAGFKTYHVFVSAETIVHNLYPLLWRQRAKFMATFTKRVGHPLAKLSSCQQASKRHVISFVRRLSHYYLNGLIMKRQSVVVENRVTSKYFYAVVKV